MRKLLLIFFQALFKALGLHDPTKRLLVVVTLLAVLEVPFAVPGMWKMAYGMYYAWKNNQPPSSLASAPTPVINHSYPLTRNPDEDDKMPKTARRTHKTGTLAHIGAPAKVNP